jgi:hypothetical protein
MMNLKERFAAGGAHFLISMVVAGLAALLVFGIWYPYPYRETSGGRHLFLLVVAVDLVIGPLITLVIFNRRKATRELICDFVFIGFLQLSALSYGMWSVYVGRPIYIVFEYSQMTVLHAVDLNINSLDKAPPHLQILPKMGPVPIALRPFRSPNEQFDATMEALGGTPLAARTDLWQSYDDAIDRVLKQAKNASDLYARFPDKKETIDAAVAATGLNSSALRYLPLLDRTVAWTILLNATTASPVGFVAIDSF